MNAFDTAAVLIAIAALTGYINHRVLKHTSATTGTLAVALVSSFVVTWPLMPSFQVGACGKCSAAFSARSTSTRRSCTACCASCSSPVRCTSTNTSRGPAQAQVDHRRARHGRRPAVDTGRGHAYVVISLAGLLGVDVASTFVQRPFSREPACVAEEVPTLAQPITNRSLHDGSPDRGDLKRGASGRKGPVRGKCRARAYSEPVSRHAPLRYGDRCLRARCERRDCSTPRSPNETPVTSVDGSRLATDTSQHRSSMRGVLAITPSKPR